MTSTTAFSNGIDVSHFQGIIHWEQVACDPIQFAYIKATDGIQIVDPRYQDNVAGAKQYLQCYGSYHFFRSEENPIAQAKLFLLSADFEQGNLIPVLDAEVFKDVTPQQFQENIETWLKIVTTALGHTPMIYSSSNFINQYITNKFANYPLWIARWSDQPTPLPNGWEEWVCWQYSSTGKVNGIDTEVDLDYFNKDQLQQHTLRKQQNNTIATNHLEEKFVHSALEIYLEKAQTRTLSSFENDRLEILSEHMRKHH